MVGTNKYMSEYIGFRYVKLKLRAVEYKGGKCEKCGYSKYFGLTFHHLDPKTKDHDWHSLRKQSWSTIKKELDKCSLLCQLCHMEIHYDMLEIDRMERFFKAVEERKAKRNVWGKEVKCKHCKCNFLTSPDKKVFCTNACYKKYMAVNRSCV